MLAPELTDLAADSSDSPFLTLSTLVLSGLEVGAEDFDIDTLTEQERPTSLPTGLHLFDSEGVAVVHTDVDDWLAVQADLPGITWDVGDQHDTQPAREELTAYLQERSAFRTLLPTLGRYTGRFVAVHDGRVVDSDASSAVLLRRFFKAFGDTSVYIGFVGDTQPSTRVVTPFHRI